MELFSISTLLLIACLIFLILSITYTRNHRNKGRLPPGPTPLPIIGNILQLDGKEVFKSLKQLSEKYGPVYTLHMGMETVVVLCSCDAVKEALIDNADDFGARGHMPLLDKISSGGHGVAGSNGERWKQLRRFSVMTLKDLGVGKRSIEERIQEEAYFITEEFRKTNSKFVDPTLYCAQAVANVICSVVFGNRFEYEDKNFQELLATLEEFMTGFSSISGQMYNLFPKVVGKLPGFHQNMLKALYKVKEFIKVKIKMHLQTLEPSSPRGFVDYFLIKMEQEKDVPGTEFHMDAIVNTAFDLFSGGTETVSITLRYGLLILLKHTDVQEHMHEEIDHVIGRNRAPCIKDQSCMPYTNAVIHEIQRFIDLVPMALPHKVTRDVHFRGFIIPKDTTVYAMISSVLRDPKQFKYPNQFYPGHFLDENGKFVRNNGYMPFSSGKRMCLGEGLAKMELFLFFTTILQNFTLRSSIDPKDLDLTPMLSGFGNIPHSYKLCFNPR